MTDGAAAEIDDEEGAAAPPLALPRKRLATARAHRGRRSARAARLRATPAKQLAAHIAQGELPPHTVRRPLRPAADGSDDVQQTFVTALKAEKHSSARARTDRDNKRARSSN